MLVESFQQVIFKCARDYYFASHNDPRRQVLLADLVAAGNLGFWQAICRFDLCKANGLNAYARHYIREAMRQVATDFLRAGNSDRSLAARYEEDHQNASPAEIMCAVGRKLKNGLSYRDAEAAVIHPVEWYDTTDPDPSEADGGAGFTPAAVTAAVTIKFERAISEIPGAIALLERFDESEADARKTVRSEALCAWLRDWSSRAQLLPPEHTLLELFSLHMRGTELRGRRGKSADDILRALGRSRYALELAERDASKATPKKETVAPFKSEVAEHYRRRGWSVGDLQQDLIRQKIEQRRMWRAYIICEPETKEDAA
jgi:hypothetical protein